MYRCTSPTSIAGNFWIVIIDQNFFVGNPTNAGKIRRYARKVLFSGVFYTVSIFQDGGMVMDENGRNE